MRENKEKKITYWLEM
ncbi:hypothetical protein CAEBREN_04109 [Caenorhabditis brenneri]|uniref:Uncharacterized protein n=1 Tax=Caenorhabditis brenneri TaxID=135651 RepID=G0MXS5_CAEBE|nr:hypothetical protein CAEBREN_04109 [Caenorhabditis brenneri]